MKLKEKDFNLIKINFEFRNQFISIEVEPYKIFKEIKIIALNKFIDIFSTIPKNLHFFYFGNDLINKEEEKIGDIFKHKEQITVQLRLPKLKLNVKLNSCKSSNLSLRKKYFFNKENNSVENNYNINNHSLGKTQYTKEKINKSYYTMKSNESSNNINNINNPKQLNKSNSLSFIPLLNTEKKPSSISIINKINKINKKKFNFDLNFNDIGNFAFCDKHKYKVSEYCRTCKKFICQECRLNQLHKDHLTIQLNIQNLEESIKLYITLLQINEKKNVKEINEAVLKQENDIIDNETLIQKENNLLDKFDKIISNYHSFMRKIDKKIGIDKKKYRIMVINNFNDVALRISMQINSILNKFDVALKKKEIVSFNDLQYYLDEISKKEETLELIRERTIKYLLTFEINNKVESTFDNIEATLNDINDEINPFNLDKKFNKELTKILNNSNNNNISNEINQKPSKGILKNKENKRYGLFTDS